MYACRGGQQNAAADTTPEPPIEVVDPIFLPQTWYYYVESGGENKEFRSSIADLPWIRFREKMVFLEDSAVMKYMAGADDRPEVISGNWKWIGPQLLILEFNDNADTVFVQMLTKEMLKLK